MIRQPRPSDQAYIAATWARSMLSTHAHQRHIRSRSGLQIHRQIDAVLDRRDTRALVSVWPHDTDAIRGWVLYVDGPAVPVVHYMYVRERGLDGGTLRGRGVVGELLYHIGVRRDAAVVCTSHGPASESMRGHFRASVHLPLAEFLEPGSTT